jgi:hypothetical protein
MAAEKKSKSEQKRLIMDIIREAAATTSSYGFPFIARAQLTFLKIIWTIAMLLLTVLALKYSTDTLVGFLDFDVVTRFQVIDDTPTTFPTIYICKHF